MRKTDSEPPFACDFTAMDSEQRERYRALRRLLSEDFIEARELDTGYAFRHSSEADVLVALAEYVSLERLCCPFFDFAIEVGHGEGQVWLRMTGPEGAKGILEAAMGAALEAGFLEHGWFAGSNAARKEWVSRGAAVRGAV